MVRQIDGGVGGDRDGAGADRHMGVGHADHIDHQRHRQDRSAAADQAQRKSDQRSRCQSQHTLHRGNDHADIPLRRRGASQHGPRKIGGRLVRTIMLETRSSERGNTRRMTTMSRPRLSRAAIRPRPSAACCIRCNSRRPSGSTSCRHCRWSALLALYWSTQVCMRALPAVSLAYFGSTADREHRVARRVGGRGRRGCLLRPGLASAAAGGGAAGAAAGVAAASAPHCGLAEIVPLLAVERAGGLGGLIFRAAFLRWSGPAPARSPRTRQNPTRQRHTIILLEWSSLVSSGAWRSERTPS